MKSAGSCGRMDARRRRDNTKVKDNKSEKTHYRPLWRHVQTSKLHPVATVIFATPLVYCHHEDIIDLSFGHALPDGADFRPPRFLPHARRRRHSGGRR